MYLLRCNVRFTRFTGFLPDSLSSVINLLRCNNKKVCVWEKCSPDKTLMPSMWHGRKEGVHAGVCMCTKVYHHQSNMFLSKEPDRPDQHNWWALKNSILSVMIILWAQVSGSCWECCFRRHTHLFITAQQTILWVLCMCTSVNREYPGNNKHSVENVTHNAAVSTFFSLFNRLTISLMTTCLLEIQDQRWKKHSNY